MSLLGRDKYFIRIAREVGQECNYRIVLGDDASLVLFLGGNNILKEHPSCFSQVPLAHSRFGFDGFENKVVGVNLAVWVWIGDTHCLALVLEDQHMRDFRTTTEIEVLFLPDAQQILDLPRGE